MLFAAGKLSTPRRQISSYSLHTASKNIMQSNARLTVFILVERQILNKSSRHLLSLLLADVNSDQINCKIVGFYKFCEVGLLLQFLFQSSYNTLISSTDCFSFAAYFAIRDIPIEWVACSGACKNGFATSGTSEGQRCFCSLCFTMIFFYRHSLNILAAGR